MKGIPQGELQYEVYQGRSRTQEDHRKITMKKTTTTVLAAAVTGLFMGGTMTSCTSSDATTVDAQAIAEKHACRTLNTCAGLGGCKTEANACAGLNECASLGGCATIAHHECAGKNACSGLGGCKTADHDCGGKNDCQGLGGCHVPMHDKK